MGFFTLYKRDVFNIVKNPTLLIINSIFPLLFIMIFGYLSADYYGSKEITSYDYYGITMLVYCVLNVSMTASNSFMETSLKSSNLRVMYSPIRIRYIYVAKVMATFTVTSICLLLAMLIVHGCLNVSYGGSNTIYVIIILFLFNFFSSIVGVLFCCIFKSEEITNMILSIVNNVLAILGGLFFSLDGHGELTRTLSYISPVKWIVECVMKIIYDHDLSLVITTSAILIVMSSFCLLFCKLFFKVEDYA
ncbi:ABC transporter permease [Bacillus fungorum]|uniref:ABC transporter permease n=1 Tax=Bacillus fungorum TaxID=2039284 RepID=UPI0033953EB9